MGLSLFSKALINREIVPSRDPKTAPGLVRAQILVVGSEKARNNLQEERGDEFLKALKDLGEKHINQRPIFSQSV